LCQAFINCALYSHVIALLPNIRSLCRRVIMQSDGPIDPSINQSIATTIRKGLGLMTICLGECRRSTGATIEESRLTRMQQVQLLQSAGCPSQLRQQQQQLGITFRPPRAADDSQSARVLSVSQLCAEIAWRNLHLSPSSAAVSIIIDQKSVSFRCLANMCDKSATRSQRF
jgi:hypothetical protein